MDGRHKAGHDDPRVNSETNSECYESPTRQRIDKIGNNLYRFRNCRINSWLAAAPRDKGGGMDGSHTNSI